MKKDPNEKKSKEPKIKVETVTCPKCGLVIEKWTYERCPSCYTKLY